MKNSAKSIGWIGLIAASCWLTGCLSDSSGPSKEEIEASNSATATATPALGNSISEFVTGEFEYGDGNTSELAAANSSFKQALALNPGNNQAKVGAAITSVLLAAESPGLSNQINTTVDAGSPLDVDQVSSFPLKKLSVLRRVAIEAARPEFHQIQDTVAKVLLPALEKAIGQLTDVYNDPAFSLTLTIDGKARTLGHSEAAILLAGFEALHAFSTLLLAYDIDIDNNGSYAYIDRLGEGSIDTDHLTQSQIADLNTLTKLLKPGSPFLTVRSGWGSKLGGVDDEINRVLTHIESGLKSIPVKTASSSHLLQICATGGVHTDCIEGFEVTDATDGIDTAQKYMGGPVKVRIPEIDSSITINVSALFNVQDFKKMLPFYNFYDASQWATKPVLYFSKTLNGTETGNIEAVGNILDSETLTVAQQVAQLKVIVYWQDPTFQGFLPGVTSDQLWTLIQKLGNAGTGPVAKRSVTQSVMNPYIALGLVGQD